MITPKISVIIPVYNVSLFLRRCLDSLLNQSFTDFEAICINDGSFDNSGDILAEYHQKDTRIKIITQKNQGQSIARNKGLDIAKGEYIYFLDSDDCIHPQALEYCYKLIEKENADILQLKLKSIDFYDMPVFPVLPKLDNITYFTTHNPLSYYQMKKSVSYDHSTVLSFYKKDVIDKTRFIPGIQMEDIYFNISTLVKSPKTILTNLVLYYYTINPNSTMRQDFKPKIIKDYYANIIKLYELYKTSNKQNLFQTFKDKFIPRILQDQLRWFKTAKEIPQDLITEFEYELQDLNNKGLITKKNKSYFSRYFFKKIIIYKIRLFFYKGKKTKRYQIEYQSYQLLKKIFNKLK